MEGIVLAAGRGSRLLPLTMDTPKCLIEVGEGTCVLEEQIRAMEACGISRLTLVLGYRAEQIEARLVRMRPTLPIDIVYNPFYDVSNALVSLWFGLRHAPKDFFVLNGDVVLSRGCLQQLVDAPPGQRVSMLYSRRDGYGVDAVKVRADGSRLQAVGKDLPAELASGESVGLIRFREAGAIAACATAERLVHDPRNLAAYWYTLIRQMVAEGIPVNLIEVDPASWVEMDYHGDVEAVRQWFRPVSA